MAKEVKVVPSSSSGTNGKDPSAAMTDDCETRENSYRCEQLKRLSLSRIGPGGSSEKDLPHETLLPLDYEMSNLPPPPEYPKWVGSSPLSKAQRLKIASHSNVSPEKLSLSRSQPDLSRIGTGKSVNDVLVYRGIATSPR